MTEILKPTKANLRAAAAAILAGEPVGMPTETVYGLAANALDATAVAKVFEVKERPTFDPLIVHVADTGERDLRLLLDGLVDGSGLSARAKARAARLATAFWPGPLTLVLPRGPKIPDLVTAGLSTVAVRMPAHPVAQALLRAAGVPLAAPSANRFGRLSPTCALDVVSELDGRIGMVLDGGDCRIGVESTVIQVEPDGSLALLRPGGVPVEAVAQAAGVVPAARTSGPLASPGMGASHYAPAKPLVLLPAPILELQSLPPGLPDPGRIGLLLLRVTLHARHRFAELAGGEPAFAMGLSSDSDLEEAAHHLFAKLRIMDAHPGFDLIVAEPPPGEAGLAHAIRDRLTRASHRAKPA